MCSNLKGVAEICKPKKYKITGLHDDDDDELIVVTQRRTKPTSIRALDYMLGIYGVVSRLASALPQEIFRETFFGSLELVEFLLGQEAA